MKVKKLIIAWFIRAWFIRAWFIAVFALVAISGEPAMAGTVIYNATTTLCGTTATTTGQGWYKAAGASTGSCVDCSTVGPAYYPQLNTSGKYSGGYKCVMCGGSTPKAVKVNGTWQCK